MSRSSFAFASILLFLFSHTSSVFAQSWKWGVAGKSYLQDVEAWCVAADRHGNVFAAGVTIPKSSTGTTFSVYGTDTLLNPTSLSQTFIIKTDSNGNFKWVVGTENSPVIPVGIVTDTSGDLYLLGLYVVGTPIKIGSFTLANPPYTANICYFLAKIGPAGNIIWAENIAPFSVTSGVGSPPILGGIGMDKHGDIGISGYFDSPHITIGATVLTNNDTVGSTTDVFVAKYDANGTAIWAKSFGGENNDNAYGASVGPDGSVFTAGLFTSASMKAGTMILNKISTGASTADLFIASYDNHGNIVWIKGATGNNLGNSLYDIASLSADNKGNVYLSGGFYSSTISFGTHTLSLLAGSVSNMFLVKYDSAGNVLWANTGGGNGYDKAWAVSADHCGKVWVSGQMGSTSMGPGYVMHFGSATITSPAFSHDPMFIVEYDSAGNYINGMALSSGADDMCGLAIDTKGNLLVATDFIDTIAIGNDTLYSLGSENLYVAKYKYDLNPCPEDQTNTVPEIEQNADVMIYPNPAFNVYHIKINIPVSANSVLELYDLAGRLLSSSSIRQETTTLYLNGIAPGTYICKIDIPGSKSIVHPLIIAQ